MQTNFALRRVPELALASCLALAVSCGSPSSASESPSPIDSGLGGIPHGIRVAPEPVPALPWTATFQSPAILVADEIRIEGPTGLREHFAARSEPDNHTYVTKAVPEGLRQVFEPLPGKLGLEVRGYLDALEIVAFKRLTLLERPGDVDLVIHALGDAFWRDGASGAEKRGSTLSFVGKLPE